MGTTLVDHFNQIGREHSIFCNTDGYNVSWIAQPTATRMDLAAGAFNNQTQALQVLNSVFESHH